MLTVADRDVIVPFLPVVTVSTMEILQRVPMCLVDLVCRVPGRPRVASPLNSYKTKSTGSSN